MVRRSFATSRVLYEPDPGCLCFVCAASSGPHHLRKVPLLILKLRFRGIKPSTHGYETSKRGVRARILHSALSYSKSPRSSPQQQWIPGGHHAPFKESLHLLGPFLIRTNVCAALTGGLTGAPGTRSLHEA